MEGELRTSRAFAKLLGLSSTGMSSFIIGNVCGFPLGVKNATDNYKENLISKDELEHLSVISSNPSVAFIISGVGIGLFKSLKIGIILNLSVFISAIITALLFRPKHLDLNNSTYKSKQTFDLIVSIKSAGYSCITVSSFIIFFCAIIGLIKSTVKNPFILALISSFFEVGSACSIIGTSNAIPLSMALMMISFSLSFSGISVFMQVFSILPKDISKKKYLYKKLLQGVISALLTLIFSKT